MLEALFDILKTDCNIFNLQYEKDKYRLVLDGEKDFTGDTVEEVLNEAVDWLDSDDSKPNMEINYKALGYESDGRE
jgi:hypothetical protein